MWDRLTEDRSGEHSSRPLIGIRVLELGRVLGRTVLRDVACRSRRRGDQACILGAPDGADEIVRWLRIYRRSTADSTATSGANLNDLLELRP